MIRILISLLLLFNQVEQVDHTQLPDPICRQVIICECEWSKSGETCTMKVIEECE